MTTTRPPAERRPTRTGTIVAVTALAVVLAGIIGVAFRGSWTAHRDAALAAHFDATGADLYPFAPDGLILIALIAALVLRHDRKARTYALAVVGVFTATSFMINHWHGLGWFVPARLARPDGALPWGVVALIAGQVIASIFFGSHLIVSALRSLFPSTPPDQPEQPFREPIREPSGGEAGTPPAPRTGPVEPVVIHADPDPETIARTIYEACLDNGVKLGRDRLARTAGISGRAANRIRADVESDRDEAAARVALEEQQTQPEESPAEPAPAAPAARPVRAQATVPDRPAPAVQEPTDEELFAGLTPAEALAGPGATERRRLWREQHAATASPNGSGPAAQDGDDQS